MYQNVYYPVASIAEGPVKRPGFCTLQLFKIEDVETWPSIDPQTGIISSTVTLKAGAFVYVIDAINPTKSFSENQKESTAGDYFDVLVKGSLRGSNAAQILTLGTMKNHQWGIIVPDKNGVTRLVGNEDSGADLIYDYTTGAGTDSRKTELTFKWQHPHQVPIYEADEFDIVIGGLLLTAGCIQFIKRFEVGAAGSPMSAGDLLYINTLIINKKVLVLVDGIALPVDDFSGDIDWTGSIQRHIEKALGANTINFVGGVVNEEIIEIYAYS